MNIETKDYLLEYYGFDQVSVSNPKPASFENCLYDDTSRIEWVGF